MYSALLFNCIFLTQGIPNTQVRVLLKMYVFHINESYFLESGFRKSPKPTVG